ncbi:MAG: ATP-binding protein [Prevotellaceae bacterium]|jgi:predicted AAA+ superfamily ATPase|nr:ATP-binding protein [Prevotellaceae bacterium]
MVNREIKDTLFHLLQKYPAVNITGPRQSGKTTLARELLGEHRYFSLENPDILTFAQDDPRGFLRSAGEKFILDEVQRAPLLFSYLQQEIDERKSNGCVVLLGSQSFLMNEHITQSLAGRVANLKLLPFSLTELKASKLLIAEPNSMMFKGFYPRLHKEAMHPVDFYPHYIETYLQRDVRQIKNVGNLNAFTRFLKLCAGRTGNILNLTSLANDADVSVNTVKSWLSILEASYIIFFVQPYFGNINRRLIKMPKLYFYDTGLACSLLSIERESQLESFYMRGNLFENMALAEMLKARYNKGLQSAIRYLRDAKGNEVDCVVEQAGQPAFVEIKMSETLSSAHFKSIALFRKGLPSSQDDFVVYAGKDTVYNHVQLINWQNINALPFL